MRGPGEKWPRKQEVPIAALLTTPTIADAADTAGISEPTLWRRFQREAFHTTYRQGRREAVSQAVALLQPVAGGAVDTLSTRRRDTSPRGLSRGDHMARPTSDKTPQKPTFKPLSIEQENAIDLLIAGHTDQQVADAVGKDRTTIWGWRHEHPLFMATLARRRAEVWRVPQEKLRGLLSKAVVNLAAAVEAGDLKASIEVLKAVGMYGDGTMNAIGEQDP